MLRGSIGVISRGGGGAGAEASSPAPPRPARPARVRTARVRCLPRTPSSPSGIRVGRSGAGALPPRPVAGTAPRRFAVHSASVGWCRCGVWARSVWVAYCSHATHGGRGPARLSPSGWVAGHPQQCRHLSRFRGWGCSGPRGH